MERLTSSAATATRVRRELGLLDAVLVGMGSIVGAGAFVGIGIAVEIAGPAVILAITVAALVAVCNGLSDAELAANHPVAGGAYEYGYKFLNPSIGFLAGWLFLCGASAAAAAAALSAGGYLLGLFGVPDELWRIGLGLAIVILLTFAVLGGARPSTFTTAVTAVIALTSLLVFILLGIPSLSATGAAHFSPFFVLPSTGTSPVRTIFHAAALMFVAYAGYSRVAILGEDVRAARTSIPRAIIITLAGALLLYLGVAVVAIGNVGAEVMAKTTAAGAAPLEAIAGAFHTPGAAWLLAVGATAAMLTIIHTLLVSLSRVILAMSRRKDMPAVIARLDKSQNTSGASVVIVGVLVAALVLIGDIRTIWSFSAFIILLYYALTNLIDLQLPPEKRRFPYFVATTGLLTSLFLAFWVEPAIWVAGTILIGAGLVWQWVMHKI